MKPTLERLRQLVHYDPQTGVFKRLVATGYRGRNRAGEVCGSLDKSTGYVRLKIDGYKDYAHRLAWFYMHGVWPEVDIDHKDRVRHHNWIDNLRPATRAINLQNQVAPSPRNTSGLRGVHWSKEKQRWQVDISVGNKSRFVGRYDTKEDAGRAYLAAKQQLHPGYLP